MADIFDEITKPKDMFDELDEPRRLPSLTGTAKTSLKRANIGLGKVAEKGLQAVSVPLELMGESVRKAREGGKFRKPSLFQKEGDLPPSDIFDEIARGYSGVGQLMGGRGLQKAAEVVKAKPSPLTSIAYSIPTAAPIMKVGYSPITKAKSILGSKLFAKPKIKPPVKLTIEPAKPQLGEAVKPKERGFVETVKTSPRTTPELARQVKGEYIPRSTQELQQRAVNVIKKDINVARDIVRTKTDDEAVAVASELVKHYQDVGDIDSALGIVNEISPKLTELGRAVQSASIYNRLSPEAILRSATKAAKKPLSPDVAKNLLKMAQDVKKLPEGIDKAMEMYKLTDEINRLIPSTLAQKAVNVWKAGLLTGIKTTGVNISSNMAKAILERVSRAPAALVDSMASILTGKREVVLTQRGVGKGFIEGIKKGWRFFKSGFDERNLLGKYDYRKINFGNSKFAKALQKYEQTIFRLMGAEDQPFYYSAKSASLYEQGKAAGMNARKKGKSLTKFVDDFVTNPSDKALANAVADAEMSVYQNKTALNKMAQGFTKAGPIGDVIAPFRRTPSAVAMSVVDYSPVGLAKTIIGNIGKGNFDQRQFSLMMGRGITGTGAYAIGAKLYEAGRVALEMPKSEKERKQWELEGKRPMSIKIKDDWVSVAPFGPVGFTALLGGAYKRAYDETGSKTAALASSLGSLPRVIVDQTFLRGVSGVLKAINDPKRFAPYMISGTIGSIVPTIIADVARAKDPYVRTARDKNLIGQIGRSLKARIPGLREDLPVRRTALGEALERPVGAIRSMIDPLRATKAKTSPLIEELGRLTKEGEKATPTMQKEGLTIGDKKVRFTPEQLSDLQGVIGSKVKEYYNKMITAERYKEMPDADKADELNKASSYIRRAERLKFAKEKNLISKEDYGKAWKKLPGLAVRYLRTGELVIPKLRIR